MVAEATSAATDKAAGKAKPRRKASTKLKPVKTSAKKAAPEAKKDKPEAKKDEAAKPAPDKPMREQVDAWNALPKDQKEALREREAARVFGLAAQHHQNGELDDAVRGYGKALLLNPRLPDAYNNMGVALRTQGKLEASVACYRRSLVLKPGNAGAYFNMGTTLRELGRACKVP
jgi:tetratricopeptide (TPR) repeat protein